MPNANRGEEGQGLVEYALLLVLVAAVVITVLALISGGGDQKPVLPTDLCPGTAFSIMEQDAGYGKRNIIVDYVNSQGDTVHLLYGQDKTSSSPFNMYSRDVDPGDDCKR